MDGSDGVRSHHNYNDERPLLTRRHLLFAGAAAVGTIGIWARPSPSDSASTDPSAPATSATPPSTQPPVLGAAAPEPTVAPAETPVAPLGHALAVGSVGADVRAMQEVLTSRQFDPGPVDGIFGGATLRAVWAFEKLILGTPRTEMSGVVEDEVWQQMNAAFRVAPRRTPGGNHMEVYLPEQVSVLFSGGEPRVISHVSSGEGITWCDEVEIDLEDGTSEVKGICGKSVTPGGVYHFERKVEGWRNAKLGRLYKPIYFNYGIAIHGASNVPDYPASRGCVRHPMHIAEYLQDLISIGDDMYVFDGVEEPEVYGPQPMIFDWPDPDWVPPSTTTTTTSTTTTTATTTAPTIPPTTPLPATTQPPPSTTTTAAPTTSIAPSTTSIAPPPPSSTVP